MNKWRIAFLVLFDCSDFDNRIFSLFINNGVTLNYQKDGYTDTENDLIINKTDLTKE